MLYFKEHIQAYEIQIEDEAGFSEAIWCNLESQGSKIIVGVVYRCPSISKDEDTRLHKGNAFVGYTLPESNKTLSFVTITNLIGSAVNWL